MTEAPRTRPHPAQHRFTRLRTASSGHSGIQRRPGRRWPGDRGRRPRTIRAPVVSGDHHDQSALAFQFGETLQQVPPLVPSVDPERGDHCAASRRKSCGRRSIRAARSWVRRSAPAAGWSAATLVSWDACNDSRVRPGNLRRSAVVITDASSSALRQASSTARCLGAEGSSAMCAQSARRSRAAVAPNHAGSRVV